MATDVWSFNSEYDGLVQLPKAALWRRLWVIRHVRAMWHAFAMERHYGQWKSVFGMGGAREWEVEYLRAIWRGQA